MGLTWGSLSDGDGEAEQPEYINFMVPQPIVMLR